MITPFIEETLGAIHIALELAGLTSSQVDEILLVGGATRTPLIRRRLAEVFAKDPRGEVDPDLCVAMGAAIQGAAMAGTEVSAVLVDVTPYTFGTSALGELNGELYPYHIRSDHPQEHADPGAPERGVLHGRRRADRGRCADLSGRERATRWRTSRSANSASTA